jgi:hypothetical protein
MERVGCVSVAEERRAVRDLLAMELAGAIAFQESFQGHGLVRKRGGERKVLGDWAKGELRIVGSALNPQWFKATIG